MLSGKPFSSLKVADAHELINSKPPAVLKNATLREAIEALLANPLSRNVYVIDTEGNLAGAVTVETLLKHVGYRAGVRENSAKAFIALLRDSLKEQVEEVMKRTKPVTMDTPLKEALYIMLDEHMTDLPIVDQDYKLIGELIGLEMITAAKHLFASKP